jgi:hypothetical protein
LAYNDDDCECEGVLNVAEDDGSVIPWDNDNEYDNRDGSLVKFGLEMAKLEYGEGNELKDELHDLLLFDKEDKRVGAEREADQFFGG